MGRRRTKHLHLPPRIRAREKARGRVFFYYDTGETPRREIPLGSDYPLALKRWAELEGERSSSAIDCTTFKHVADRYVLEVVPTKAPRTQRENAGELKLLLAFFNDPPAPLDEIQPIHVRQFLDHNRARPVRANRARSLFSSIWNFAREKGYTDRPNPCAGVKGYSERGRRGVYVEDDAFAAVWKHADQPTRDAMDLIYLTGQRPADALAMDEPRGDAIPVRQQKTGAVLRIAIEGELAALLERIRARKRAYSVVSTRLLVNESGQALTAAALRKRFDKARAAAGFAPEEFQLRDLRAKAGTDKADSSGDVRQAQRQLGHASVTMTEHYVRERRGALVKPTK